MIDYTACRVNPYKAYGGANGNKINIEYEGHSYMLKFPSAPHRNIDMSYTNGCISEYLACHIFESLGFRVQHTLLGTYRVADGREKLVVACGDFTEDGKKLMEFAQLKNTCIDSEQRGYGTDVDSIMAAIDEQQLIPPEELREFFWDMFIADALLGNFDRHNGNWGILVDEAKRTAEIAPIYDCGSCLYPQLAPEKMEAVLNSEDEIQRRIMQYPNSAIEENGKKISYFEYISSLKNPDCNAALLRVSQRIDWMQIQRIIDTTPTLLPIQKDFYTVMLQERERQILSFSLERLMKQEQSHQQIFEMHMGM